jgi:putative flippase GtrA
VNIWRRVVRFQAVGAIGAAVQMAALAGLRGGLHVQYLVATALAVEIAVLHNFVWHERWTWGDRSGPGVAARLLRFNLGNGLVSIVVNVALMRLLAGHFHMHYLVANLLAIAAGAAANFAIGHWWVFRRQPTPSAARNTSAPAPVFRESLSASKSEPRLPVPSP